MYTPTLHFEINSKQSTDGRYQILLRLGLNRKKKRIATKIYANKKNDFNAKAKFGGWLKGEESTYPARNNELKNIIYRAEKAIAEMETQGVIVTLESLSSRVSGKDSGIRSSFIEYARKVSNDFRLAGQIGSHRKYNNFIFHIVKYARTEEITFGDITVSFITGFETYLRSQNKAINTVEKLLKIARAVTYRAIQAGIMPMEKNPWFLIKIKTAKTARAKLSWEELMKIEQLELEEGSGIWHSRNYFIFSLLVAGIRWGDLCTIKWSQIENSRLTYKMGKTGLTKSIKLIEQALKILSYYERYKTKDSDFIFPILDKNINLQDKWALFNQVASRNVVVNKNLKKIAERIELKKNLSFHISRHTWSDLARTRGNMSVFDISKALGHSSLRITERYLSALDLESLDSSMEKVFQK